MGELGRYPDAHADAEDERAFDVQMLKQQLGVLGENLPRQQLDTATDWFWPVAEKMNIPVMMNARSGFPPWQK